MSFGLRLFQFPIDVENSILKGPVTSEEWFPRHSYLLLLLQFGRQLLNDTTTGSTEMLEKLFSVFTTNMIMEMC